MKDKPNIVIFSMGKMFHIRKIALTIDEANDYMLNNKNTSCIAEYDGKIFIAETIGYTITDKSFKNYSEKENYER